MKFASSIICLTLLVIAFCVTALPSTGKYNAIISFMPIEFQITDDQIDVINCLSGCSDQMQSSGAVTVTESVIEFNIDASGDNTLCNVPPVTITVQDYSQDANNAVTGQLTMTYDNTTVALGTKCLVFNQGTETFGVQLIQSACPSVSSSIAPTCSGSTNATSIVFTAKLDGVAESTGRPGEETVEQRESLNSGSSAMYSLLALAIVFATVFVTKHAL